MKKLIKTSIILASSLILCFSLIVDNNVNAKDSEKIPKNSKTISIDEIMNIIESNDYDSIKMIKLNDEEKIESVSDMKKSKSDIQLEDGVYVIDRKSGWIKGKDVGVLKSIIIPSGAQGGLQSISYSEFSTQINNKITTSFGPEFIKYTLEVAFGSNVGKGKEITVKNFLTAPKDKNIFLKAQTVYRKYEVVRIKDGKVVDHGTAYQPEAYATEEPIEFAPGTTVNQKKLYKSEDFNILGNPSYNIVEIIEDNIDVKIDEYITPSSHFTTGFNPQEKSVGIYFTVSQDGKYEFRKKFLPYTSSQVRVGIGASVTLYKIRKSDNKILEVIDSKPYNFKEYNSFIDNIGEPVVGNLKSNEKYLLAINESHRIYWNSNNQKVNYNIKVNKVN